MSDSPAPTPAQLDDLARAAEAAAHHAYAPYSRFYVGAAVLLASGEHEDEPGPGAGEAAGEIVSGCNVENASYRLTSCAEQTAIAAAVARFGPGIRIAAVAVHNLADVACQPCGACRQTIAEFAAPEAIILFPGKDGRRDTCTLADLLPSTFKLTAS